MSSTVDVIEVKVRDAVPGDLVTDRDEIVGRVIAGREGEIRVELEGLPGGKNRWSWNLGLIRTDRPTLPVLANMRRVLAEHRLTVKWFEIVREVS
jgi:hypothetical protein